MRPSDRLKDVDALEYFRLMLKKAESTPGINKAMTKFGYDAERLSEGKELLQATREIYEEDIRKKDELSISSAAFSRKRQEIDKKYRLHRNKAKIVMRGDKNMISILGIDGKYHKQFQSWLVMVRKFYNEVDGDEKIQKKLMRLRLTKKEIDQGLADIAEIEKLEAQYYVKKGGSQQSTVDKRKAFDKLHNWKKDFYAVAKMALNKKPELLEALYKAS